MSNLNQKPGKENSGVTQSGQLVKTFSDNSRDQRRKERAVFLKNALKIQETRDPALIISSGSKVYGNGFY